MKSFILVSVCLFCSLVVYAQDIIKYKNNIGAAAGFSTGYGLSYRYIPSRFGVQLTFAPYVSKQEQQYSTGLTFLYRLIESNNTNLYLYQGNHYFYHRWQQEFYEFNNPIPRKEQTIDSYFNDGFGIGIEFILAKRIGFNLMTGYAAYVNFTEYMVTGETGLYYKF